METPRVSDGRPQGLKFNRGPNKRTLMGKFRPGQIIMKRRITMQHACALNYEYLRQVREQIRDDTSVPEYHKVYPEGVYTPNEDRFACSEGRSA